MPPAIIDHNHGNRQTLPPQPTRGGFLSNGMRNLPQYRSPYIDMITDMPGMAQQSSLSIRPSSSMSIQPSGFYGTHPHREHMPASNSPGNQAPRLQAQTRLPVYQGPGASNQYIANPLKPPQMQRILQFQARGLSQPAVNGSSHSHQQDLASRNNFEAVRNISYVSPYHRDPSEQMTQEYFLAPYHSDANEQMDTTIAKPQGYSQAPVFAPVPQQDIAQRQLPRHSMLQSLPSSSEPSVYPSSSPSPAPSPSRRGRPPGSKNLKPSKLAIEIYTNTPKKPRGRPSRKLTDTTSCNSLPVPSGSESGQKKRGRPFKSAETAAKAVAKARGDLMPGKRGRPMKVREPEKGVPIPLAEYITFDCEWKGCTALLHNLETLKRHVMVAHGRKGGAEERVCAWRKCAEEIHDLKAVSEGVRESEPAYKQTVFGSWKERNRHLEKAHFVPFSWHVGDGPKATCLERKENKIDPWLLDKDGNQVTPSLENQSIEGGVAKYRNKQRWMYQMKKLNINIRKEATRSSYMKTPAQIAQEENTESEAPSGSRSGSGEAETGNEEGEGDTNTGDDNNEDEANGGMDDVEMDGVEMEQLQPSIEESEGDDVEDEDQTLVLDRL